MKLKRRDTEVFSMSFLDVICCGFGAIILLLVLSEFGQPLVIEKSREDLEAQLKRLQDELVFLQLWVKAQKLKVSVAKPPLPLVTWLPRWWGERCMRKP
jgi:hypothetical protein